MRDLVIAALKEYHVREDWPLYSDKELLDLLVEKMGTCGARAYWDFREYQDASA